MEYLAARAVGVAVRILPRRARWALGRLAGSLIFTWDAKHRAVTLGNLDLAFGDAKTPEEKYAIARGAFQHFGTMLFELISLGKASPRKIERMVEFEGVENYERARARGKGVILVAAHFGNWEVHAIAHGYRFGSMSVVARAQDNPYYNRWLEEVRTISGNGVVYKQQALVRVRRLLKDGETVGLVVDQNVAREDGVFVDFFGRKAATTPVASLLALKTGAILVPVFAFPLADGRYRCIYEEPIERAQYAGFDRQRAVLAMTQRCAQVLEGYVRRNPEFWLWMHRRWKTRPLDELEERMPLPAGRMA